MRIVAADERTRRLLRRARLHSLLSVVPGPPPDEPALAGAAGCTAGRALTDTAAPR